MWFDLPVAMVTTAFTAVFQTARCAVVSIICPQKGGIKLACFPYPVESIRFSRTKIAPTRRFMQFERRDAREANVYDHPSGRMVEEYFD